MFLQNRKERPSSGIGKEQNIISGGTKITGNINANGDFRIDGTVEGTVKTKGKVVIGKAGIVNGGLESENLDVEGKINGKIKVIQAVNIRQSALVEGELKTAKLTIAPGATFNAKCDMKEGKKSENQETERKENIKLEENPKNQKIKTASKPVKKQKQHERRGSQGKEKQST